MCKNSNNINFFLNLVDCVHVCDFLSSLIPMETRLSLRTCSLLPPPFCFPLTDLNPSIISGQIADSLKRRKQNENLFLNEAEWNINILTEAGYAQNARCQREHRSAWPQTSAWWRQKDLREQQRHVWGQTSRLIWQKAKVHAGWHTSSGSTRAKDRNRGEVCFKASTICKTAQNISSGARTSWVGTAAPGSGTCPFSRPAGSQPGCETSGFDVVHQQLVLWWAGGSPCSESRLEVLIYPGHRSPCLWTVSNWTGSGFHLGRRRTHLIWSGFDWQKETEVPYLLITTLWSLPEDQRLCGCISNHLIPDY